ncbi:hypothetical protein [Marinobacterium litorale]|uniref:hypothetical protein n=1 Tax=Marinobacterium litorale TaxID=404770 RepID=UPI0003F86EEB|nr:hypothetical protein [Marinobacterium litorale]
MSHHGQDSIGLIGFDERERNLLEVFLDSSDNPGLVLDSPERADSILFNCSSDTERRRFLDWLSSRRRCAVVAVVADVEPPEGAYELRRPLSIASLRQCLRTLARDLRRDRLAREAESVEARAASSGLKMAPGAFKELLAQSGVPARREASTTPPAAIPAKNVGPAPLLDWSEEQKRQLVRQATGALPELDVEDDAQRKRLMVSLDGQFLDWVRRAVDQGRDQSVPVKLTGVPGVFVYDPVSDQFSYDLDADFLIQMATSRFGPGELGCEALEQAPEGGAVAPRDEVLWLLGLMSTRGRIPDTLDPRVSRQLKPVKGMPHALLTPQAERIADFWSTARYTPTEVMQALKVPQNYVFSFMVAADAADLFERT